MKLDHLRDFIRAAACPDMKAAAGELNIAPSVLSKHIKAIEDELSVALFVSGKKNVLTSYGKIFLPYAKEIIALEDDFNARTRSRDAEPKELLTVAMSSIQMCELSGHIAESYAYTNPGVKLNIIEVGNSEVTQYVKDGKCDFGFYRSQSEFNRDSTLSSIPIVTSRAVVYVADSDPLSKKERLTFSDLKDRTIYLRSENSTVYRVCVNAFKEFGTTPKFEFASDYALYEAVKSSRGVTIYLSELNGNGLGNAISVVPLYPEVTSYIDLVFKKEPLNSIKASFLEYAFHYFMINL